MKLWALALAVALTLSGFDAEAARRLGGGKSFGKQSSNVTQRDAASPAPASPAAPGQNVNNAAAKPAPAAAPAAAQAPKRPWGAMLGGLAAGLGLAWLAALGGARAQAQDQPGVLLFLLLLCSAFASTAAIAVMLQHVQDLSTPGRISH